MGILFFPGLHLKFEGWKRGNLRMAHGWGTPSFQGVTTDKAERTPQVWIPVLITLSISLFEELWVCRQETSLCPDVSADFRAQASNFKVMTITWRTADTPRWLGPTPEFQMCHVWSRDWDSASLRSVQVRLILMLLHAGPHLENHCLMRSSSL